MQLDLGEESDDLQQFNELALASESFLAARSHNLPSTHPGKVSCVLGDMQRCL